MTSPRFLSIAITASLLLLCAAAYLLRAALRTWTRGQCWHCGAAKVRRSKTQALDKLAAAFLLAPYRCAGCRTRFYGFRTFSRGPRIPSVALRKRPLRIRVRIVIKLPTRQEFPAWLMERAD